MLGALPLCAAATPTSSTPGLPAGLLQTGPGAACPMLPCSAAAVPPAQRPTATAGGLPPAQGYVVLERPYGFKQWVDKYLDSVPGER